MLNKIKERVYVGIIFIFGLIIFGQSFYIFNIDKKILACLQETKEVQLRFAEAAQNMLFVKNEYNRTIKKNDSILYPLVDFNIILNETINDINNYNKFIEKNCKWETKNYNRYAFLLNKK